MSFAAPTVLESSVNGSDAGLIGEADSQLSPPASIAGVPAAALTGSPEKLWPSAKKPTAVKALIRASTKQYEDRNLE
jgi:hypothetical protein